jgi:hypothetical protein
VPTRYSCQPPMTTGALRRNSLTSAAVAKWLGQCYRRGRALLVLVDRDSRRFVGPNCCCAGAIPACTVVVGPSRAKKSPLKVTRWWYYPNQCCCCGVLWWRVCAPEGGERCFTCCCCNGAGWVRRAGAVRTLPGTTTLLFRPCSSPWSVINVSPIRAHPQGLSYPRLVTSGGSSANSLVLADSGEIGLDEGSTIFESRGGCTPQERGPESHR